MDPEFPKDSMYLPLIEKSVLKLEVFVRNIIEYYQNKERKKSMVPVNIAFMVEEIVHSLEYFQNASEIHYIKQFDLEIVTVTDEFRLKVILNNLISNAIKYQREDEANKQIRISAKSNSEQIILEVSDNGIGIKSSSKEHIFDMFYRATNQESGSGIGLYILKDAVNKLGGQISFESETGVGTTFKVMIPNNPTTNL
jgi:signal transduction histidine kinase